MTKRVLAVFDFDRTITNSGSLTPWLWRFVRRHPGRLVGLPVMLLTGMAYKLKLLSRKQMKETMLKLMVRGLPAAEIAEVSDAFIADWIAGHCRPGALAVIARHRANGDRLMMATASNDVYMTEMAHRLGFDHLVCTASARAPDGGLTGGIPGPNCYGADTLDLIKAALDNIAADWEAVVAYSDHHTDLPMLAWATRGVAVNPNRKLRKLATTEGFEVVDWGRPG